MARLWNKWRRVDKWPVLGSVQREAPCRAAQRGLAQRGTELRVQASIWVGLVCGGITPLWSDTLNLLANKGWEAVGYSQ